MQLHCELTPSDSSAACGVLPNFLIIGAPKAGTTALYQYLDEHPEVFMSRQKGPRLFTYLGLAAEDIDPRDKHKFQKSVKSLEEYAALFAVVSGETAVGEASPNYLASARAARNIHAHLPGVKLIAILRDPAARLFSAYWMSSRKGREKWDLAEMISAAGKGANASDEIPAIAEGFYFRQLSRYYELFPSHQISVYLTEDLKRDGVGTMQDIYRFLGVDKTFVPNTAVIHNPGGRTRFTSLERCLQAKVIKRIVPKAVIPACRRMASRLRGLNRIKPAPMTRDMRAALIDIYRSDILQLQTLLGRDLSAWMTV